VKPKTKKRTALGLVVELIPLFGSIVGLSGHLASWHLGTCLGRRKLRKVFSLIETVSFLTGLVGLI
jgi:hypothetical protein